MIQHKYTLSSVSLTLLLFYIFLLPSLVIQENTCTLSYLVMPFKNGVRKRRMYRGPKTERKLAFKLDHQLHLQETKQQRPFTETCLGRLPGEIRNKIYEHLLILPPSQPTRHLRVPLDTTTDSDISSAKEDTVTTDSKAASAELPPLALGQKSRSAKVSYVAILQTCRQINREAYHIFYANNTFHFTSAPDLTNFLIGVGPLRRAELTSLHLEGLVVDQPFWTKEDLDCYCLEYNISSDERKQREAERHQALHPEISKLTELLDDCKNLSRLRLEMRACELFGYFLFVSSGLRTRELVVYLVDGSRWVARWPCTDEHPVTGWKTMAEYDRLIDRMMEKWNAYRECFPLEETEALFPVVVDIVRGTEEALGEGYQSWVAIP